MLDFILTPNMNLPEPIVGVTSGPNYATYIDSCLTRIDGHTHLTGSGVPITPAALNINSAVDMLGWSLINTEAVEFSLQTSSPSNSSIFSKTDGNLYFTNSTGGVVQITNGLQVNASSSGIISGTASAAFSSNVLVVNEATSTPANIQVGSILIGNNLINSNFVTLSVPSALGSGYTLVLPAIPAQKNVMTLDASGNMSSITYDQVGQSMTSVGANAIGSSITSMSSASADVIAASRTRDIAATVGVGGVAESSIISFSTGSTSFQIVPYSVTITTSGRPIFIGLFDGGNISNANTPNPGALAFLFNGNYIQEMPIPGAPATGAYIPIGTTAIGGTINGCAMEFSSGTYYEVPTNTLLAPATGWEVDLTVPYALTNNTLSPVYLNYGASYTPPSAFWTILRAFAGTYTFQIAIAAGAGGTVSINGPSLVAYEL